MGVSKQAAQKRFVPREGGGLLPEGQQIFSRFTQRARNALAAAGRVAGAEPVDAAQLAAGLLAEPEGLAAKVIQRAGLTGEQVVTAVGAGPAAAGEDADAAALRGLSFGADGKAALKGALKAALRYGHNYIGTEHLLLGVLFAGGATAQALASLGLDGQAVERLLAIEFAEIQARRKGRLTAIHHARRRGGPARAPARVQPWPPAAQPWPTSSVAKTVRASTAAARPCSTASRDGNGRAASSWRLRASVLLVSQPSPAPAVTTRTPNAIQASDR